MMVTRNDISKDIVDKLAASGIILNQAVVNLILDSEHEEIRNCLLEGHEVDIPGCFTVKAKSRGVRIPSTGESSVTYKIDASIDSTLRSELLFRNKL